MNSCILMAEIVQEPELRYTSDNQTAIAQMLVQFPGLRAEDPPATLKVVGWGNLAQEIQQNYHQGDRVIIEGRLSMNTFERSEGFKEKRAELTVQRIHALGDSVSTGSSTFVPADDNMTAVGTEKTRSNAASNREAFSSVASRTIEVEPATSNVSAPKNSEFKPSAAQVTKPQVPTYQKQTSEPDVDDIPF